jgi:hypothetical protein
MDSFQQRAAAILETARAGSISEMTVLFSHDGGLRLIMEEPDAGSFPPGTELHDYTARYRLSRRGRNIRVTGSAGNQTCLIEGRAAPFRPSILLDNQPRYTVVPAALPGTVSLRLE